MKKLVFLSCSLLLLLDLLLPALISGRGNRAHNTLIRYTYGDLDPLGPPKWNTLPDAPFSTNFCRRIKTGENSYISPGTPLNILTSKATLPIRDIEEEFNIDLKKPSLTFQIHEDVEKVEWLFGYSPDIYHGLEVSGPRLGLFQVLDLYHDYTGKHVTYDFNFATITFCNLASVSPQRSSHQLDGKRYPFEMNMIFFSETREIGVNNSLYPMTNSSTIMISILGEIGKKDNLLLKPLLDAAKEYRGGDFEEDDRDTNFAIKIKPPFSPTWILPRKSQYYYYQKGNFPVPPCFPLTQVYVLKSVISISQAQLNILTNVPTEREHNHKFSCNFGLLRTDIGATRIYYNPYPISFIGTDNMPSDKNQTTSSASTTHVSCVSSALGLFSLIMVPRKRLH